MVSPTASRWRRCGSTTSVTAAPGCARSRWSTASTAETPGWPVVWRPGSTRDTPSSTECLPMALSDRPAERHRQVGQLFTDRVRGTRRWNVPSPVAGWAGRDGADGRDHPVLRPVRGEGRGARRCRPADQAAGIHRPRSLLDTCKNATGVSVLMFASQGLTWVVDKVNCHRAGTGQGDLAVTWIRV